MIKVLVVDGYYLMRMGLVGLLSSVPDFVVSGAGDGEEAIQIASEQSFDVAVMDLCLPNTEGSELVSRLLFYCFTVNSIFKFFVIDANEASCKAIANLYIYRIFWSMRAHVIQRTIRIYKDFSFKNQSIYCC